MKSTVLLLFFGLLNSIAFSQNLKGRVVDDLNLPIPGASVYYDGTTIATSTDENGEFTIRYDSAIKRPLVVSYIGYQTIFIEEYAPGQQLLIAMEASVTKLKEVVVKKQRFSRKEMMRIFKDRFLGSTRFGLKSIIKNEADIDFDYDEKSLVLKASSDKPVLIINPLLGYKVTYELVDFEAVFNYLSISPEALNSSYYAGLSQFEDIESNPKITKNRDKAYQGSTVNFFRNLINGTWSKSEFQIFSKGFLVNPSDFFEVSFENDKYKVSIKKQEKAVGYIASVGLLYNGKEQSQVKFLSDTIYIDQFGNNLSIRDVYFSGPISLKRVGDMLPLNYTFTKN